MEASVDEIPRSLFDVVTAIRRIDEGNTPIKKLNCIIEAINTLGESVILFADEKEGRMAGVEDILPALAYSIVKSRPPRLL